jgi:hypothetical protein
MEETKIQPKQSDKKSDFLEKMDYLKLISQSYSIVGELTSLTPEQLIDQKQVNRLIWLYSKKETEGEKIENKN